ncbi:MAG: ribosome silencing factor [Ruminococcaceae bacterium]|nr:ribosome silencing factor [Oscillospiraceae bacterium]
MSEEMKNAEATEIMQKIVSVMDAKKAHKIHVLYVNKQTTLADYFVICNGNSSTQIRALSGDIEYTLGLEGYHPLNIEGHDNSSWVLMDYASVIVHIFNDEAREFYNLDKLWQDGEEVDISTFITEN